jgi:transcriptional regulator with XRE-family HTH domain
VVGTLRQGVGQRLLLAIEHAGMNQADLADRLGVKPATVSRWISGVNPISLDMLERIGEVCDCTVGELLPPEQAVLPDDYRAAWGALEALRPVERQAAIEAVVAIARTIQRGNSNHGIERVS